MERTGRTLSGFHHVPQRTAFDKLHSGTSAGLSLLTRLITEQKISRWVAAVSARWTPLRLRVYLRFRCAEQRIWNRCIYDSAAGWRWVQVNRTDERRSALACCCGTSSIYLNNVAAWEQDTRCNVLLYSALRITQQVRIDGRMHGVERHCVRGRTGSGLRALVKYFHRSCAPRA